MTIGDVTRRANEADDAPLSADLFWYRGFGHAPMRIGTSRGVGFVTAILDEQVVRAIQAASGRPD
jgi:hypothetical protein